MRPSGLTTRGDTTVEEFGRIVEVCDDFESRWRRGERPRIEDVLAEHASLSRPVLLRELLALELELARDERVAPTTAREFLERFPDHVDVVEAVFAEVRAGPPSEPPGRDGTVDHTRPAGSRPTPGDRVPDAPATDRGAPDVATRVGKYRVVRPLRPGGQGVALLAFDPDLRRHVVLKRHRAEVAPGSESAALREGQALARVHSPYVARCLGVERDGRALYLVIEYIAGADLAAYHARSPLGYAAAAELIARVAEGLAAVHACGLLHRDIKPSNILIGDDGIPRLVDFGLAVPLASADLSGISGTLAYMAPEQARGEPERIDPRTDVFGLGAVLYELLCGRPPYRGKTREEVLKQAEQCLYEPPCRVKAGVPRGLERICLKAMAAAPENRYASASELRRALRRYRLWRRAGLVAGAMALLLPFLALVPWGPKPAPPVSVAGQPQTPPRDPPVRSQSPRILNLEIRHLPLSADKTGYDERRQGILGDHSFSTTLGDDITLQAELSQPAYSYLLAFRPDGGVDVCDPKDEDTAPDKTDHPRYPPQSRSGDVYRLGEGTGLHAFALIVSRAALPPFREWSARHGKAPWGKGLEADPGIVWRHDGRYLVSLTAQDQGGQRGKGHEARGGGSAVAKLADWLRGLPGIDDILVEAFAVQPPAAP
jgi:serine/threonine protein kinase